MMFSNFYKGKKVLITGHTGFKGSWLSKILIGLGSEVIGYSLPPNNEPNLFDILGLDSKMTSITGDVRDYDSLIDVLDTYSPEIVIHMAAQPLVGHSYEFPRYTFDVNVMGTVNLLDAVRNTNCVKSIINVTTDKVYLNNEWAWGYREADVLDGYDPYSNSKSCSDLITGCYARCFLNGNVAVSTVRAGNVIGGGDFTNPRIIPDCMRAALSHSTLCIRNPYSTRPYQHVLEPLFAYLMIAERQYSNSKFAGSYNVGPLDDSCVNNLQLVELFAKYWGNDFKFKCVSESNAPHEANYLKLDISKICSIFGWRPVWTVDMAVKKTVDWIAAYARNQSLDSLMESQIEEYMNQIRW